MCNVGDVVTLKSGGPEMTVIGVKNKDGGGYAECVYFDVQTNKLEGPIYFHVLCLEQKKEEHLGIKLKITMDNTEALETVRDFIKTRNIKRLLV